jgi:plastocyanin
MATVTVTVDTTVSPPKISFAPDPVPIGPGKTETIQWTRAKANFTFAALAFDHKNPFSNVVVQDSALSADDNNQKKEDHLYVVLVKVNGTYYSSKDGSIMGNSGPTIRNN